MKSLVELLEELFTDVSSRSGADLRRDVETLRRRVDHEGESFITIALPNFCRDFERCLDSGRADPGLFASFGKLKSGVPAFLQGLLFRVFDRSGTILQSPSVDCIRSVRQICLFGKKVDRQCSDARLAAATERYVQCDDECVDASDSQLFRYFRRVAEIIVGDLDLDVESMVPKHGPGQTQERLLGNQKWRFQTWHRRMEEAGITRRLYARGSARDPDPDEGYVEPRLVEPGDEPPVRVTLVPKTQKTPRVIAVEPVCMQYAQQGLKGILVSALENCRFTAGHINFRDQSVNQKLAKAVSENGYLATLDMAEASDLVSLAHVETLFATAPSFLNWALASRSTRAELPNGEVTLLKKFASMGSALCFPVEALVFFTGIIASRLLRAGTFPTRRSVHSLGRAVYVYGDDLIVPADEAPAICEDLEALGFKVNRSKSFWTGRFRESCGTDCYGGEEVTPVYLRRDLPTDRRDVSAILSSVATVNQLFSAGYGATALLIRDEVERVVGKLPTVADDSAAIGWHFHSEVVPRRRWNRKLQRVEILCYVPYQPKQADPLDGDAALAKVFRQIGKCTYRGLSDQLMLEAKTRHRLQKLKEGDLSYDPSDPDHLEMSPRPYALTLKRKWVPIT